MAPAGLQKILDLEKDVSKLRHHVSVLSKGNHRLQKAVDRLKKEEVLVFFEVASPDRVEEPEPQVVAEPEEGDGVDNLAVAVVVLAAVAGVRMPSVAAPSKAESRVAAPSEAESRVVAPSEAESRVAMVVYEVGGPSAIGVPVAEVKRRWVDDLSEEGEDEVRTSVVVLTGPRGGAPMEPRLMAESVGRVRRGSGVQADLFVTRAYRFVLFVTGPRFRGAGTK